MLKRKKKKGLGIWVSDELDPIAHFPSAEMLGRRNVSSKNRASIRGKKE